MHIKRVIQFKDIHIKNMFLFSLEESVTAVIKKHAFEEDNGSLGSHLSPLWHSPFSGPKPVPVKPREPLSGYDF